MIIDVIWEVSFFFYSKIHTVEGLEATQGRGYVKR